jgi:hypothetical protein
MKAEKSKSKPRDASGDLEQLPESLKKSLLLRVVRELNNVQDNPRLLVLITHGLIELLVNALVHAKCKNSNQLTESNRDFPHTAKLVILHEMELLSDFRFQSLNWFWRRRNDATHKPLFDITLAEIRDQFQQVTDTIIIGEDGKPTFSVHSLYQLCMMVIVSLWSDHSDVFAPIFVQPGQVASTSSHTTR